MKSPLRDLAHTFSIHFLFPDLDLWSTTEWHMLCGSGKQENEKENDWAINLALALDPAQRNFLFLILFIRVGRGALERHVWPSEWR